MAQSAKRLFRFGPFRLDPEERTLFRDDLPVPLTPKTFQTLLFLVQNHGRTVERDELIRRIWPDSVVEEGNLSFQVHQVRKALGGEAGEFIATIPRRGYRFVAQVTDTGYEVESLPPSREFPPSERVEIRGDTGAHLSAPQTGILWARSRMWLAAIVGLAAVVTGPRYFSGTITRPASEATATPAAPLTGAPGWEFDPSFSPDGRRLAYVWQDRGRPPQVYIWEFDSRGVRQLTSVPESVLEAPRWSGDGKRIAFVRASGSMVEFYAIDASGGDARFVAQPSGTGPIHGFDWSPDGTLFAFSRSPRLGAPSVVFLLRLDTGRQTQITHPEGAKHGDRDLAFSPDGRTLAFVRYPDYRGDIYRVPIEGGEPRRLTSDMTSVLGLAWTADGREIVFSSRRAGAKGSLWRIPVAGGTPSVVVSSQLDARYPSVSPRGNRLAFSGWITDHNIWRMPIADANERQASASPLIDWPTIDAHPAVSPDGRQVAFMSDRSGSMEVWSCDLQGENCLQLTSFAGPHTGVPRWSADGQWLAVAQLTQGDYDIFVVNLRRDAPRRITFETSADTAPSWSRDGKWIYFGSDRTGRFEVWKAPVNGQPAVQVTRNGGFAALESSDGRFLFYTKRHAPGLWQMPIEGGAETLILRDDPAAMCWGYWAVTKARIYFVRQHSNFTWSLDLFDLSTHRTRSIAALPSPPGVGGPGLTVTPDGRHILISLVKRAGSNIMLVENFF